MNQIVSIRTVTCQTVWWARCPTCSWASDTSINDQWKASHQFQWRICGSEGFHASVVAGLNVSNISCWMLFSRARVKHSEQQSVKRSSINWIYMKIVNVILLHCISSTVLLLVVFVIMASTLIAWDHWKTHVWSHLHNTDIYIYIYMCVCLCTRNIIYCS